MDWRDGQARTAWLNNVLQRYVGDPVDYYLGPTGIPQRVNALTQAAQFTDAGDYAEAVDASRSVWNDPTLANVLRYGTAAGALAIPMVSARMMQDGVDVAGDAARSMYDDASRFWRDESGALTTGADPAVVRADEVLDLLRQGRGAEVTDEMLDMGDPVLNARMNSHLWSNYDLPMDEASRMARARELGFDLESYLRHGSKRDFPGFQIGAEQSTDYGWYGQGVSLAPNDPSISDAYAMVEKEGMGKWGGRVYPVTSRGRMYEWPEENPPALNRDQSIEITQSLRDLGYEGANVYAPNDFDTWGDAAGSWRERVIYDPRNIRSRFARFDPRLAHLRNLSAGLGGAAVLNGAYGEDEEARRMRELLEYLNQ